MLTLQKILMMTHGLQTKNNEHKLRSVTNHKTISKNTACVSRQFDKSKASVNQLQDWLWNPIQISNVRKFFKTGLGIEFYMTLRSEA